MNKIIYAGTRKNPSLTASLVEVAISRICESEDGRFGFGVFKNGTSLFFHFYKFRHLEPMHIGKSTWVPGFMTNPETEIAIPAVGDSIVCITRNEPKGLAAEFWATSVDYGKCLQECAALAENDKLRILHDPRYKAYFVPGTITDPSKFVGNLERFLRQYPTTHFSNSFSRFEQETVGGWIGCPDPRGQGKTL